MEHRLYAQVVGSIMYAMLCTRPDLSFAVSLVSRFQSNLGEAHWVAVKRILRYIKGTKNHKMTYSGKHLKVIGYSNFDFSGDTDDGKCTSGYIFLLGQGAISWCNKKQSCVAKSTMEAEYIACSCRKIWFCIPYKTHNGSDIHGSISFMIDNMQDRKSVV